MENKDHCTCAENNEIQPHTCPYQEELNNDHETLCECCPYCEMQCFYDT